MSLRIAARFSPALFALVLLGGCASPAVQDFNREPRMSPVGAGLEPEAAGAELYASPPPPRLKKFSLWNDRQSRLFTDPRALSPGDILTVKIQIDDKARFKSESERNRTSNRTLGVSADLTWIGIGTKGDADAGVTSKTSSAGDGATERSEKLELLVAAVVTNVLPNGNMVIRGSQEVRVNAELRVLTIAGIVRPQDIGAENTIPYERIAEARISYGGRGRISEVQQPPYGQQLLDRALPF